MNRFDELQRVLADRYRLDGILGQGGSATVYRAFDLKHGRSVAIKVLQTDLLSSVARERFLREIEIAAQLQHPHIVPMIDSGEALGSAFFVMPLLEGETLRARLERTPVLPVGDAVRIVLDLADALAHAHRHGVAHRDVKPENIMLAGRHALVMDFGVAKALHAPPGGVGLTGAIALGTPTYMAPEQAMADPHTDHRADLYALGVVAYEMLTGVPPITGSTPQETLTAHLVLTPEPIRSRQPAVPEPLAALIEKCLAKSPADRWQQATDIIAGLEGFATPASGSSPAAPAPRRWVTWVAAAVALVALGSAAWDLARRQTETPDLLRSERLTFLGTVREAALSPDGTLLAYVTADGSGQKLLVADTRAEGRPVELVANERVVGVRWVADGAQLSFTQGPADAPVTHLIPRLGGTSTALGRGRGLVSPDGNRVLIATGGDPNLIVLDPKTGDTLTVRRPGDGWMSGVAWSPTSDRLAVTVVAANKATAELWVVMLDGRATRRAEFDRDLSAPTWSEDGRDLWFFAAATPGRDLYRVGVAGSGAPRLMAAALAVVDDARREPTGTFLSLGDRGRRLVYVAEERWSNLARFRLGAAGPAPAPEPEPELFTMGTALYAAPRLSPDASQVAVFVSTARGTALGTVASEGNTLSEIALTTDGGYLAWSPKGNELAYSSRVADSGLRVVVRRTDTPATPRVIDRVGLELTWSPAGLVVQRPGNRGFDLIDPSRPHDRRRIPADTTITTYAPRAAPDGMAIAALTYRGTAGPVSLSLIAVADGGVRTLLDGAYRPIGWSSDGRYLYATRNSFAPAPEQVVMVPTMGGPPKSVATLPPGYASDDISRDGRLLVATQLQSRADVAGLALP